MTRILDTSFLIAAFDEADPRRKAALQALSKPEPVECCPEVLGETLGVVHARFGYSVAMDLLRQINRIPHLRWIGESPRDQIQAIFTAGRGKLSWVDAAVVHWCRAKSAAALEFDSHIAQAVRPT